MATSADVQRSDQCVIYCSTFQVPKPAGVRHDHPPSDMDLHDQTGRKLIVSPWMNLDFKTYISIKALKTVYTFVVYHLAVLNFTCQCFPSLQPTGTHQDIMWLEFFAGTGNLTKVMTSAQYKSCRFDIMDNTQPGNRRSNFMDLAVASGFAFLD